ncbi:MAG: glycosyltransferase family 39 protein [Patescibacteria group bacterium]|jgi:hypothetical protein
MMPLNKDLFCKFKKVIANEYFIIAAIIFLAYLLRVLPYLLGYPLPFTENGIMDFDQVKYLISNHKINFTDSYYYYGSFPVVHLIIFFISLFGFDALKTFLFVPQIFASLGILFFYLFLRRYFSVKQSLFACFLIAVFGPHIHWSAQPGRESLGLFFFPLVIYLFDREFVGVTKKSVWNKILLVTSLILMILSHHWSTIMLAGWLLIFSFLFIKEKKKLSTVLLVISYFVVFAIIYWYLCFPMAFTLINNRIYLNSIIPLVVILLVFLIWLKLKKFSQFNLNQLKIRYLQELSYLSIAILVIILAMKILPMLYPLQLWLMFIFFALFILVGFFSSRDNNLNKLMVINIFYLSFWVITVFYIINGKRIISMPFDPFRTLEFMIFPSAIAAAVGFLKLTSNKKSLIFGSIGILIFLATLTYPPIFIYKNKFQNTIFYDIRSEIRYLPSGIPELVKWANNHGYGVKSIIPEVNAYQRVFFPAKEDSLTLVTNQEKFIADYYDLIKDPILKIPNPKFWVVERDNQVVAFENDSGKLIRPLYDARFISFDYPSVVSVGEKLVIKIRFKNTGSATWLPNEVKLIGGKTLFARIDKAVLPDEVGEFIFSRTVPALSGDGIINWYPYHLSVGLFGDWPQETRITVVGSEQ